MTEYDNYPSNYQGNAFLHLIMDEAMAEGIADRELSDEEKEKLRTLCDSDSRITRHFSAIRQRYEELVRRALDE